MIRSWRRVGLAGAVVLAVVLLAIGVTLPVAAAQSNATDTPTSESIENSSLDPAELTLAELQQGGTQFEGDDPSLRVDNDVAFTVRHWPADATSRPGEDDNWKWLRPGALVQRNSIWLGAFTLEDVDDLTLTIVYYQVGEREAGNSTATEQYATNVTVDQYSMSLGPGFPSLEEVNLRQSNEPRQVSMWIEGYDVRWSFKHHSVATTQTVPFDTWGGLAQWAVVVFVMPISAGSLGAVWVAKKAVMRAGRGPGYGYVPYLIVSGILAFLAIFGFYDSTAEVFVKNPMAVSAALVAFVFILVLETLDQHTRRIRFVRDKLRDAKSPSSKTDDFDRQDTIGSEEATLTLIDPPNGPLSVASKGIRPFLARLVGGISPVRVINPGENADHRGTTTTDTDPLRCKKEIDGGFVDEEVYVHPESPVIVDHKSEGWHFDAPRLDTRGDWLRLAAIALATLVGAGMVGWWLIPQAGLGVVFIGIVAVFYTPYNGYLEVWPAPVHYRQGRASMIYLAEDLDDAETIREEREKRIEESVSKQKEILDEVDNRDSTLLQALFAPPEDRPDVVDRSGDADSNGRRDDDA